MPIFDYPDRHNRRVRRGDPATSYAAVGRISPLRMNDLHQMVLDYFTKFKQSTDWAMQEWFTDHQQRLGIDEAKLSTMRSRRNELVKDFKLLQNSGRTVLQAGSNRIIWELVPPKKKVDGATE